MTGKRDRLARALSTSGLLKLSSFLRRPGRCLSVLAYHRVSDIVLERYLFDENLISASLEGFDRQMKFVKDHFDVLTFQALKACLASGKLPGRPLIITFDDGYRDNYTHAYPILRKYHLPAVIFLATGYIGGKEPFWFEKVAYWIKRSPLKSVRFGLRSSMSLPLNGARDRTLRIVQEILKSAEEREHRGLMTQLEEQIGFGMDDDHPVQVLTWDEVLEMHRHGIEFGSHSVSHLNLAAVTQRRCEEEIYDSKHTIEKKLGSSVLTLAYPIGGRRAFSPRVKKIARQAGYSYGVSYVHGVNPMAALDAFAINRIHVERDTDFSLFEAMLSCPGIFL